MDKKKRVSCTVSFFFFITKFYKNVTREHENATNLTQPIKITIEQYNWEIQHNIFQNLLFFIAEIKEKKSVTKFLILRLFSFWIVHATLHRRQVNYKPFPQPSLEA